MKLFVEDPSEWEFADMFWSYAKDNVEKIVEADKMKDFMAWVEDLYPEGISMTKLNDILSFEPEVVFNDLGIEVEE